MLRTVYHLRNRPRASDDKMCVIRFDWNRVCVGVDAPEVPRLAGPEPRCGRHGHNSSSQGSSDIEFCTRVVLDQVLVELFECLSLIRGSSPARPWSTALCMLETRKGEFCFDGLYDEGDVALLASKHNQCWSVSALSVDSSARSIHPRSLCRPFQTLTWRCTSGCIRPFHCGACSHVSRDVVCTLSLA